jgi:hypothetical protein
MEKDKVVGKKGPKPEENLNSDGIPNLALLYHVINLVLYCRVIGVKVPLVYSILNSNT